MRLHKPKYALAAIAIAMSFGGAWPGTDCLEYEPVMVVLSGRLVARTYPGPPNYESIAKGDRADEVVVLLLDAPSCVHGDPQSDLNTKSEASITELQVVLPQDDDRRRVQQLLGERVIINGTLFHSHTGHHRTDVLIVPKTVQKAP